jgi:hypothetical protein
VRGHFIHANGFDPFSGDGITLGHGHAGIGVEHLRSTAATPCEKAEKMVLTDGTRTGWSVGFCETIRDAATGILHDISFTEGQYAGQIYRFASPLFQSVG